MNGERLSKAEKQIRHHLKQAEDMVKQLEKDDVELSQRNYHNGQAEGLRLALAIILSNIYDAKL